ncbi:acetyl-CoA carboxylase biotin carboxylase subunit [Aestuariivirga litoralis]|uniref:acetyl-CoA carboxylase biotin carboxylase subunit n=1 Tax=Aestuariivirga litoralis TaxID=2650924 RepID=UPI0018C5B22D|nr:acetyl/propionyl/methylcrotonyl-CoA carboxylase subunit alpha [Aestuariivirga litoralis]MBG1232159.1 acetyl/propionyl/methylcrotonyl-CoA carboxylase subunit alpha [Aestuariivirga litoralis]
MFKKILIANRGEIACRVIKTARRMGIATVAVYSDADKDALHVEMADEAVHIGPAPSAQSYLVMDKIIAAAKATGAEAIHPGYGFLSEKSEFSAACEAAGIAFIGPPPAAIAAMGDKITSKKLAAEAGVSTVPGFMGLIDDEAQAVKIAKQIGYPVMIKATAGGGGKGMRIAFNEAEAREGFALSRSEAKSSFGDDRVFIEKFVTEPRHIEIQVLGDKHGTVLYLNERECSIQRRNQKVVEEAPSPFLDAATRKAMGEQAVALAKAVGYFSAGTVEFIVDNERNFYFLEMNTRLQVEHPVTELITGLDLVEQMIRVAAGEKLAMQQSDITINGWAMESRLYAEDPFRNFLPSIGRLTRYRPPREGEQRDKTIIRNDTGVYEGGEISMFYDPMIAKLCTWAPDRILAINAMQQALDDFEVEGIGNNLPFLSAVMGHDRFRKGTFTTAFIAEEFPDGFKGVTPSPDELLNLARIAAFIHVKTELRASEISGTMPNHTRALSVDWNVRIGAQDFAARVIPETVGKQVSIGEERPKLVSSAWVPGQVHGHFRMNGHEFSVKISTSPQGIRLRMRGIDVTAQVRSPRVAALASLMPVKKPRDTSKLLLCPMPGLIRQIAVAVGDKVEAGQMLAVVEAMKMENVLRAERGAKVKKIAAQVGDSLAVDQLIMEFE